MSIVGYGFDSNYVSYALYWEKYSSEPIALATVGGGGSYAADITQIEKKNETKLYKKYINLS